MSRRRPRTNARPIWTRLALVALAALPVVLALGYFVGKAWLESWLRGEGFRQLVQTKASAALGATVEVQPFSFSGLTAYCAAAKLSGGPLGGASADHLRAQCSLDKFWDGAWLIETIEVDRVALAVGSAEKLSAPVGDVAPTSVSAAPAQNGWLPRRVEIGTATVRSANLDWPGGSLRDAVVTAEPRDGGWNLLVRNGRATQHGLPALDLGEAALRWKAPTLFIQRSEFKLERGVVASTGEITPGQTAKVDGTLTGVPLAPFLSEDWRYKLSGTLAGEFHFLADLEKKTPPLVDGRLMVSDGKLEALPLLDKIATFTKTERFRRLPLTNVSGDFRQSAERLAVKNFVLESAGLLRIEGAFDVVAGQLAGDFQIGVSPATLQWLPGAQDKVFTVQRGGYVWTTMRLAGPASAPGEDLSDRLTRAAGAAAVEQVEKKANEVIDTGRDVIKSGMNLLFGR